MAADDGTPAARRRGAGCAILAAFAGGTRALRVIVAGGGIGGLVAALSLHAAGLEVEVFESVVTLRPLGVGINLLPHAVRELDELGLRTSLVVPMVDRDPLPRWSFGRMTLLGDAAHPMVPVGSNGASQAILDARVLAGCLRAEADPVRALADYEAARRPATAAIVLANRQQGPEECMTLVEQRAPAGFERLSDVISDAELAAIADKYKRLAGFSVDELNRRPSLAEGVR